MSFIKSGRCNPLKKGTFPPTYGRKLNPQEVWDQAFSYGVGEGWDVNKCHAYANLKMARAELRS